GFKIQTGGEAKVLVCWPGITIYTPVLAAAIRIDAGFEADVRTVVMGDDGAAGVFQALSGRRGAGDVLLPALIRRARIVQIGFIPNGFKSVGGIFRCPSAMGRHSAIIGATFVEKNVSSQKSEIKDQSSEMRIGGLRI